MENAPTIFNIPPPPFPAPPRGIDLSPLEFVLALVAVVTIPALIYTCFYAVKCPPNPFRGRDGSSSGRFSSETEGNISGREVVSDVKTYEKDTLVKDVDSECPVCLSVFVEGEEVKQLSSCKHSFHATCIAPWLDSHSNCPVCRASIVKRPNGTAPSRDEEQGLPDASSLV